MDETAACTTIQSFFGTKEKVYDKNFKEIQKGLTMTKSIVIAERDNIAAVMENNRVMEFFVHRGEILLGDVYLAKVDNILPSIDAAFVDVGSDKMGFLHAEDIIGKGALKDKIKPRQNLIVQVVKEPTGHKGPRVTTMLSIPGRFLVLMPQETGVNVSRKITSAKERARLKSVVNLIKPVGVGVIVRTEAEGQTEAEIQDDLEMLLEKWNTIITAAESHSAPCIIHRDQDLLYRVIREACTEDVTKITVDTAFAHQRVTQLLQAWNMNKNITVETYKGSQPLLVASGIHKEIKAALQVKVNLPSGGYLFIQPTEALTVIDVNSGKFISSATQDETILKTNIEAVHEIARQLKLRNIGGMVIIDFIDMNSRTDKLAIMQELELALEDDKSKPQVGQLSDLGLVELTRHRQGQSLSEVFTKKCPHCQGTGNFIEEFSFSSAVADGEYRAKAAKVKLPGGQKPNKNNKNDKRKFDKNFNKKQNETEELLEPETQKEIAVAEQSAPVMESAAVIETPAEPVESTVIEIDLTEKKQKRKPSRGRKQPRERKNNKQVSAEVQEQNDTQAEKTAIIEEKEQPVLENAAIDTNSAEKKGTAENAAPKTGRKPRKATTRRKKTTKEEPNNVEE